MNIIQVSYVIKLIAGQAFNPTDALGGTFGAVASNDNPLGLYKIGIYPNEAGAGSSPIAHAAVLVLNVIAGLILSPKVKILKIDFFKNYK